MVEGLLAIDPDGNYYPTLATEVPSLENGGVSEDGLTITYNLRDDIVWSDGEPFTCDDVALYVRGRRPSRERRCQCFQLCVG